MPRNLAAQLVKSLTFEVEAIPQDNAFEFKKTENMTPLNVKVRVRKKADNLLLREGLISIPRIDQPDTPTERLRLASSDQTIMSFNMVLEADLEKKAVRKPKRGFFGICLGNGEDDDDTQYKPSASDLDNYSKSDSGVVKLKHVRPVADDIISSNSSIKKDKIFGKCKPGGCLDPPFGEEKYAYQPTPLRHKRPATTMIDAEDINMQEQSSNITPDKISSKKKQEVKETPAKDIDNKDQDLAILSLYQGEPGAAIKENDSGLLITYPPTLSSSGMLVDEKNEARRTSGARQSRKSFNEFSTEYFSPTRSSKESRDSSRSERKKHLLTKEILSPGNAKSVSSKGFRQSIEKSGSKDSDIKSKPGLKREKRESDRIASTGVTFTPNDEASDQKTVLRTTSQEMISELVKGIKNEPDREGLDKSAAIPELAGIGAAAAGLAGIGVAAGARKDIDKSKKQKENPLFNVEDESRDPNLQHSDLGSESTESNGPPDMDKITVKKPLRGKIIQDSENKKNTVVPKSNNANISPPHLEVTTLGISERNFPPIENMVTEGTQSGSIQKIRPKHDSYGDLKTRPIHDDIYGHLSSRGMLTTRDAEGGITNTGQPMNEGIDGNFPSGNTDAIRDFERDLLPIRRPINNGTIDKLISGEITANSRSGSQKIERKSDHPPIGAALNIDTREDIDDRSKRAIPLVQRSINDIMELDSASRGLSSEGINKDTEPRNVIVTGDSERNFMQTGSPINNDINEDLQRGMTAGSGIGSQQLESGNSKANTGDFSPKKRSMGGTTAGSETGYPPIASALNIDTQEDINDRSKRAASRGKVTTGGSDRGFSSEGINEDTEPRKVLVTGDSERNFMQTGPPINNDINENNRGMTVGSGSDSQQLERGIFKAITGDFSPRESMGRTTAGSETGYPPIAAALNTDTQEDINDRSKRAIPLVQRAMNDIIELDSASRGKVITRGSDRGLSSEGINIDTEPRKIIETGDSGQNFIQAGSLINNDINEDLHRGMTVGSRSGSQQLERGIFKAITGDFSPKERSMEGTTAGSETGFPPMGRGTEEDKYENNEGTYQPLRRAMSDSVERDLNFREKSVTGGSGSGFFPVGMNTGTEPKEVALSGNPERASMITEKSTFSRATYIPTLSIKQEHSSWENILSKAETGSHGEISVGIEKDHISWSKSMTGSTEGNITSMANASMSIRRTSGDDGEAKKRDASATNNIFKSPSDIISQYRENKILAKTSVVEVDIEPPAYILEQAGRNLGDWGSDEAQEGQYTSSIGISPNVKTVDDVHSMTGSHRAGRNGYDLKPQNDLDIIDASRTGKNGKSHSRESIFLNLAFQTYLDENQTAVKTLDSSKDQDLSNVVLVRSLLRSQDQGGISVPMGSKHVMNIAIMPAPTVKGHKSRRTKPISKFDSGKSESSYSTISSKDRNDTHAALSKVFHQELVPLRSIIKSLKDDIDSLATQQMMLKDRLEQGPKKARAAFKKCGCLKRTASSRTEP